MGSNVHEASMTVGAITTPYNSAGIPVHQAVRRIWREDVDFVDVNVDPGALPPHELRELYRVVHGEGIPVYSVFALYDLPIVDPQVSREVVASMKRRVDFAVTLGARNLLAGTGRVTEPEDREKAWATSVRVMRQVAEYCESVGIQVAVELEPFDSALVNSYETLSRFLQDVGSPACRANLDIAHCALRGISPEQAVRLGDRIIHVHVADCDGVTHHEWVPGRGNVDIAAYVRALSGIGFRGGLSLELEPVDDPDGAVREGVIYLRRLLAETEEESQAP